MPNDLTNATTWPAIAQELGFDPDTLRAKYRAERDKRVRHDGNTQYQETEGSFSHYVDDPYLDNKIVRDPLL